MAQKTCGGTLFEIDGVTPATDCTPGYTEGDSVCAGGRPCAFVHGKGNAASGVIGCDGLEGVDVTLVFDPFAPPLVFSGEGGPGSALFLAGLAVGSAQGPCDERTGDGPDGKYCTADDPQALRGLSPVLWAATTGQVSVDFLEEPPVSGTLLDCAAVASGAIDRGAFASVSAPYFGFPGRLPVTALTALRSPLCGNGALDPGEACDTGGQSASCEDNCVEPACGDGILNRRAGEECEDGNTSDADACRSDCRPNVCGDGFVNPSLEACDDGNAVSGDGCDVNCTPSGNAVVAPDEECDDGNMRDGDCCSPACALDPKGTPCTDGDLCNGAEACDAAGACTIPGTPLDCDDGKPENEDLCDPERGCLHRSRCPGDCNGSTAVTIDELVFLVRIGLGCESVRDCEVADGNQDAAITIDEVVRPVNYALQGCQFEAAGWACVDSGGAVASGLCCQSAGDFPNTCAIGPCGCAPQNSHEVRLCLCGPGRCFDGNQCVDG